MSHLIADSDTRLLSIEAVDIPHRYMVSDEVFRAQ